jgi:hypothetical protein
MTCMGEAELTAKARELALQIMSVTVVDEHNHEPEALETLGRLWRERGSLAKEDQVPFTEAMIGVYTEVIQYLVAMAGALAGKAPKDIWARVAVDMAGSQTR